MDLATLSKTLNAGKFGSIEAFAADMRLIFENCMRYNVEGSPLHRAASDLWYKFKKLHEKNLKSLAAEGAFPDGRLKAGLAKCKNPRPAKRPKSEGAPSATPAVSTVSMDDEALVEMEAFYTFNDLKSALNIFVEARRFELSPGW